MTNSKIFFLFFFCSIFSQSVKSVTDANSNNKRRFSKDMNFPLLSFPTPLVIAVAMTYTRKDGKEIYAFVGPSRVKAYLKKNYYFSNAESEKLYAQAKNQEFNDHSSSDEQSEESL